MTRPGAPSSGVRGRPAPRTVSGKAWWLLSLTECQADLGATATGLSSIQAASRLSAFGPNLFRARRAQSLPVQFFIRFRNPLVIILLEHDRRATYRRRAASRMMTSGFRK